MNQYNKLIQMLNEANISYKEQATLFSDQIVLYKNGKKISDVIPDPMGADCLEYMGPCAGDDVIGHLTAKKAFNYFKKDLKR